MHSENAKIIIIKNAILNDLDQLIFAFHHCVFFQTENFQRAIMNEEISIARWKFHRKIFKKPQNYSLLERAVACFYLNRTNFSGILRAMPIGGMSQLGKYKMDCRFNKKDLCNRIELISHLRDRITLCNLDAIFLLNTIGSDAFIYADPPYEKEGRGLYSKSAINIDALLDVLQGKDYILSFGNTIDGKSVTRTRCFSKNNREKMIIGRAEEHQNSA